MIQTKPKSRWRGQSFVVIGELDKYYICKIGRKKFVRIHKNEVVKNDEGKSVGAGSGA